MNHTSSDETSATRDETRKVLEQVYLFLSVLTLVESCVTLLLNATHRTLRRRRNIFVNSLCASIGALSLLSAACNVYFLSTSSAGWCTWCCLFLSVCGKYLHVVASLSLTCLALDRYLAICRPLHYHILLTKVRCRYLCVMCWAGPCLVLFLAASADLMTLCSRGVKMSLSFLWSYTVLYSLAALGVSLLYALVALEFCREQRGGVPGQRRTEQLVRYRSTRSALGVLTLYLVLSLPHTVVPLVGRTLGPKALPSRVQDAAYVINRVHLLLFFPVYVWSSTATSRVLRGLLRAGSSRRPTISSITTST